MRVHAGTVKPGYGRPLRTRLCLPAVLTDNIDFAWGDGEWHPYMNMPGLYTYNGTFQGVLMRTCCDENIIVAHDNERTLPVYTVTGLRS